MLDMKRSVYDSVDNNFVKTGDIKLVTAKKVQLLEELRYRLTSQVKTSIFSFNGQLFNYIQDNSSYISEVNSAESEWNNDLDQVTETETRNHSTKDKLIVKELMHGILGIVNEEKMSIYCLGGGPGIAEKAAGNINEAFPEIILAGTCNGFFFDKKQVFADIQQVKPDLLLIGMGVPFEDNWIFDYFNEFDATLIVAVGPYLDDVSGEKRKESLLSKKLGSNWIPHLFTLFRK